MADSSGCAFPLRPSERNEIAARLARRTVTSSGYRPGLKAKGLTGGGGTDTGAMAKAYGFAHSEMCDIALETLSLNPEETADLIRVKSVARRSGD